MQRGANYLGKVVSTQNSHYFSLENTPEWFADKFGIFITSICFAHEINGSISPQMMGTLNCNFFGMTGWRHRRQTAALYMRACLIKRAHSSLSSCSFSGVYGEKLRDSSFGCAASCASTAFPD
tara:strand:- start:187 stop:555 length:369 start_codon:yes stop_codon:yes gene_type:complete